MAISGRDGFIMPGQILGAANAFKTADKDNYFHYLANKKSKTTFWSKKAEQITKAVQSYGTLNNTNNPLKLSPLHVAAIKGNTAAVKLFVKLGADIKLRDECGVTAGEYARFFSHPESYDALFSCDTPEELKERQAIKPHTVTSEVEACLTKSFPALVQLPPAQDHVSPDDFNKSLKRVLLTRPMMYGSDADKPLSKTSAKRLNISHGLKNALESFGLTVKFTSEQYTPRDTFVYLPERGATVSTIPDMGRNDLSTIGDKASSYQVMAGLDPSCKFSKFDIDNGHIEGTKFMQQSAEEDFRSLISSGSLSRLPVHVEGGNVLQLTNNKGEKVVLMGNDMMPYMHLFARSTGLFDDLSLESVFFADNQEIYNVAKNMYQLGCMPLRGRTGVLDQRTVAGISNHIRQYPLEKGETFEIRAVRLGAYPAFKPTPQELVRMGSAAGSFKAEREKLYELVSESFAVDRTRIVEVPKHLTHLDNFLMPGPNGTVFVQDYGICHDVLLSLKKHPDLFDLTSADMGLLDEMIKKSFELKKTFQGDIGEIQATLESAGLTPIPTPGIFYGKYKNFNFLNALTGSVGSSADNTREQSSKKSGGAGAGAGAGAGGGRKSTPTDTSTQNVVMTYGYSEGDNLGKALMDTFHSFLKQYVPEVKLMYIGADPVDPTDFRESTIMNQVFSGVHCATKELPAPAKGADGTS